MVFALPWKYAVIVKVLGFHLKMPFTDHGGFVSRLFHFYGEHLLAGFDSTSQIHGPIDVVVLTGQYASARRLADGVGAKGILEKSALLGEPVQVWGRRNLGKPSSIGGNSVSGMVIGHNEKYVGFGGGSHACRHNQPEKKNEARFHGWISSR